MKYSLSNIIKDLLAKIPVLENRINTLSTKITNINNNSVVKRVSNSAPEGNTLTLVEGAVESDGFRIIVGDEGKDNLYVSFDTCDNGDEKMQFRQYGLQINPYKTFGTPIRTAVILGRNGETTFPVSVTAPKFVGSLQGNADIATTATMADKGNWNGKNDNRWYQMAFSLGNEFNWNSTGAFQYNPASNVLKVGTVQGNITGNAKTATNVAWSGVTGKPNLALKDGDTIYTNDWFRSRGATGWYNESYGGGWYMTDSTWIRAFNNKSVYTPAKMQADGGFYGNLQGTATNADTVDGYHASDLLRTLASNKAPVMTDIFDRAGTIDLSALSAADKARHKTLINKQNNVTQNLWNNTTGIYSYGGDVDMANGLARGTLKITQSYKDFDKILVVASNEYADWITYRIWDTWELAHAFSSCFAFDLLAVQGVHWIVYGSVRTGTATNYVLSTDTVWSCSSQDCGIIAIYGIKY